MRKKTSEAAEEDKPVLPAPVPTKNTIRVLSSSLPRPLEGTVSPRNALVLMRIVRASDNGHA